MQPATASQKGSGAVDVDKLFRDKLQNRSVAPSNEAWERLQARMQPPAPQLERKPVAMWYYSAAAAVTLLLGVGFWTLKDEINFSQPQTTIATAKPSTKQTGTLSGANAEQTATYPAQPATNTKGEQPEMAAPAPVTEEGNQLLAMGRKNNSQTQATSQPAGASGTVDKGNTEITPTTVKFTPAPEMVATVAPTKVETVETSTLSAAQPLEVTVILSNAEPVALAQAAPAVDAESDNAPNTGRVLKGILKQVKNLKDGEKISLSELGITKQTFAFESRIGTKKISKSIEL